MTGLIKVKDLYHKDVYLNIDRIVDITEDEIVEYGAFSDCKIHVCKIHIDLFENGNTYAPLKYYIFIGPIDQLIGMIREASHTNVQYNLQLKQ